MMMRSTTTGLALLLACLAAAGCDRQAIRTYAVPKERPAGPHAGHAHGAGDPHAAAPTPPATTATWTLPAGWSEDPTPRSMRHATLRAGQDLEVALSRFPGDVGGLEANVNRWREQLGLAPLSGPELEATLERLDVDGGAAVLVDLRSGDGRTRLFAALLPRPGETWFVKASGPAAAVEREREALRGLVASLRFQERARG